MYINYRIYKEGDRVLYEGEVWTVEFVAIVVKDTYLLRNGRNREAAADHACNLRPYIESNKEGKHYLEKLED